MDIKKKLIDSSFATLIAEIITLPICTLKTVYQTNNLSLKQTVKTMSLSSYFQASIPAISSQVMSTTTKFTAYEIIKKYRQTKDGDILNNSINGLMGGLIGTIFTHPFDVWKNYSQRNQSYYQHLKNHISIKTLYQGYIGSMGKNIILYSLLFPLNDFYHTKFNNTLISAPLTTLTISLISQPFDYYKVTRMALVKTNSIYRGTTLMLARNIPHFLITMSIINWLKKVDYNLI